MELLIESVRENKVLYDSSDKDYMRTKYKDEIWNRIATELGYSNGKDVKDIWKKLRDCHRDALRRQGKKRSGDAAKTIKLWTYRKQMEFLLSYMVNRATTGNIDPSQDDSNNTREQSTILSPTSQHSIDEENDNRQYDQEIEEERTQTLKPPVEHLVSITHAKPNVPKKQKIDDLLQKSLENHNIRSKQRDEERKRMAALYENNKDEKKDSLYQFFFAMYCDAKKMPKASQLRIKRKLFEAVQLEEESIVSSGSPLQECDHTIPPQSSIIGLPLQSPSSHSSCSRYKHSSTPNSTPEPTYQILHPAPEQSTYFTSSPSHSSDEITLPNYFQTFRNNI